MPSRLVANPSLGSQSSTLGAENFASRPTIQPIKHSDEYMLKLRCLIHSERVLEESGYVVQPLNEKDLVRKKKCPCCKKAVFKAESKTDETDPSKKKLKPKKPVEKVNVENFERAKAIKEEIHGPEKAQALAAKLESLKLLVVKKEDSEEAKAKTEAPPPVFRCKFHDGVVRNMMWTCCGQHLFSDPCKKNEAHTPVNYVAGQLEAAWLFHETPTTNFLADIRHAVAIDCEMAVAYSGDSELVRVTLIDFFTAEVLIDSLVYPDADIQDYKTRYSGVTRKEMEVARRRRECFMGKTEARLAVWKFVGPETIVVGHSAHNDLSALRWIHKSVIDTWLLEDLLRRAELGKERKEKEAAEKKERGGMFPWVKKVDPAALKETPGKDFPEINENISTENEAAEPMEETTSRKLEPKNKDQEEKKKRPRKPKGSGPLCLKTLAKERLGREIQTGGKHGHDSLEDALASRDLAHWKVENLLPTAWRPYTAEDLIDVNKTGD
ncbi:hypothetical protein B0J14DRAFT_660016 [Halenospora varia]|nr:hypothetical protein B0J14DRAFT_660016 [Halenospora varia]